MLPLPGDACWKYSLHQCRSLMIQYMIFGFIFLSTFIYIKLNVSDSCHLVAEILFQRHLPSKITSNTELQSGGIFSWFCFLKSELCICCFWLLYQIGPQHSLPFLQNLTFQIVSCSVLSPMAISSHKNFSRMIPKKYEEHTELALVDLCAWGSFNYWNYHFC